MLLNNHVYSHIIFAIFHKMLSPIKVNLTRISVKFVVCQLRMQTNIPFSSQKSYI